MKIQKRNIATIILAILCAIALAIGVSFVAPKVEKISASAASSSPIPKSDLDAMAQAAGYANFGAMSDALNKGTTFNASNFGSATVSFGGMKWFPVQVSGSSDSVQFTLWLKDPIGKYSISDGTYSMKATSPLSNDYTYSWLRAALNMGITDLGYYYGSWGGASSTTAPRQYANNVASNSSIVAPNLFTTFSAFLSGGAFEDYVLPGPMGDSVWLPSIDEIKPGGSWNCSIDQWAIPGETQMWTRSSYPGEPATVYYLGVAGSVSGNGTCEKYPTRPAINVKLSDLTVEAPEADETPLTYTGSDLRFPFSFDAANAEVTSVTGKGFDDKPISVSVANNVIGGDLVVKSAGTYTVEINLKSTVADSKQWCDDKGGIDKRELTFTVKPFEVPDLNFADNTYDGTSQSFTLSNATYYNVVSVPTSSGMTYNSANSNFEAINAGTYTVKIGLADTANYCWSDNTTDDKSFNLKINKAPLTVKFVSSSGSWSVGQGASETITVTEDSPNNAVTLVLEYKDADGAVSNTGISKNGNSYVLDLSAIAKPGTYTLVARIDASPTAPAINANYEISVGNSASASAEQSFEIGAGKVDLSVITLQYKQNVNGSAWRDYDEDGFPSYDIDGNGNPIEWLVQAGNLPKYITAVKYANDRATNAGTYKVTVTLHITDGEHVFDDGTEDCDYEMEWKIDPKEINFTTAPWSYSSDGINWTEFSDKDYPIYTGAYIYVQISEKYLESLGMAPGTDVQISYTPDSERLANVNVVTQAYINITNSNFKRATNDPVTLTWKISNKQIVLKDWSGSSTITADGKAFTFPAVTFATNDEDYSKYIEYLYTYTIDGVTYTNKSKTDMIADVYPVADSTKKISGTVTVQIQKSYSSQYDLVSDNCLTQWPFTVGDSKTMVLVDLLGDGSEYGSVTFGISAVYYDGNDKTTDPHDFIALAGQYLQLVITNADGETITVTADDVSSVKEFVVNAGSYKVELAITDDGFGKTYAVDTPMTFTVVKKAIALPTLSEIIFSGKAIKLADYLGGSYLEYKSIIEISKDFEDIRNVSANGYTALLALTDPNYCWAYPTSATPAKATVNGAVSSSNEFSKVSDSVCSLAWNVTPIVVDTTSMWNKTASNGATLNLPQSVKDLISGGTLAVGYRYFDDSGNRIDEPEYKGGSSFKVDAVFSGTDAELGNVVFKQADGTFASTSQQTNYTVPTSGMQEFAENFKAFMTGKGLLGLPVWAWFLIGLALLILLIIIIVVAAKRRKTKEQREEIKAKKEEEKQRREEERQRREEERQAQKERLEAERELAKAKQEAELEKIRAQAGMGMAGAGMATMAMQQQPQPQSQPQPAPQYAPMQQPYDNGVLARIEADLAEIKARQNMSAGYAQAPMQMPMPMPMQMPMAMPQYMPMPQPQSGSAGGGDMMSLMQTQLAEMRAEQNSALKTELEIMKLRMDQKPQQYAVPQLFEQAGAVPNGDMEKVGALAVAIWRKMNSPAPATAIPQSTEESTQSVPAQYPSDAVITTTTTVDTTKSKPVMRSREETENFDVDGFYDEFK